MPLFHETSPHIMVENPALVLFHDRRNQKFPFQLIPADSQRETPYAEGYRNA